MRRDDPTLREYARLAAQYDLRWDSYIGATIHNTVARLPFHDGQRLIDVGCGTGQLLSVLQRTFPNSELAGVDASAEMLSVARARLGGTFPLAKASADSLPVADDSLDCVVSTSVFHYLRRPEATLHEFRRILRPGGQLVITDWCDDYLACKACDLLLRIFSRSHYRTYTRDECDELLERSAFDSVFVDRYRINWPWGLMTARAQKSAA